jgi:hypothetical protein
MREGCIVSEIGERSCVLREKPREAVVWVRIQCLVRPADRQRREM